MSGIHAVPYSPPCAFQQKQSGRDFKYVRMDFTIDDSFMCSTTFLYFQGLEHIEHEKSDYYIHFL